MTKNTIAVVATSALGALLIGGVYLAHYVRQEKVEHPTVVEDSPGKSVDVRSRLGNRRPIPAEPLEESLVEHVRRVLAKARPNEPLPAAAALELSALLDADSPECSGWLADLNGDGKIDLILKRYWTGSGSRFELLICLNQPRLASYTFSGGERGITYYATEGRIPVQNHLLGSSDGKQAIIIPNCLVDRGADSMLNWPSVYVLREGQFVIADNEFRSFYESQLLPKYPQEKSPNQSADVRAVRELVRGLH